MNEENSIFSGQSVLIQFLVRDTDGRILNLSTNTAKSITLKSPKGVKAEVVAVFSTDGTDGLIEYQTTVTDMIDVGTWKAQGEVTYAGPLVYPTSIVYIPVKARI